MNPRRLWDAMLGVFLTYRRSIPEMSAKKGGKELSFGRGHGKRNFKHLPDEERVKNSGGGGQVKNLQTALQ